jgi:hypothetical protein
MLSGQYQKPYDMLKVESDLLKQQLLMSVEEIRLAASMVEFGENSV